MKTSIIISIVSGTLLLIFRLIGVFSNSDMHELSLILAMVLIFCVTIPLIIIDRIQQNRKINAIINSYKGTNKSKEKLPEGSKITKGWGMNNSPFRDRKSSASWGGGNIKGANVTRGNRKSFLK